jgi:hypothetical protein
MLKIWLGVIRKMQYMLDKTGLLAFYRLAVVDIPDSDDIFHRYNRLELLPI